MTSIQGNPGDAISQMITIDNPNAIENEGLQIEVLYDKDLLTPMEIGKTALTEQFTFYDNLALADGKLIIAGFT